MENRTKVCKKCRVCKPVTEYYVGGKNKTVLFSNCKACHNAYCRLWAKDHPDEVKRIEHRFGMKNREKISAKNKRYSKTHPEYTRERNRRYCAERMPRDPNFRIASNLRKRLLMAVRSDQKAGSAVRDLGCTIEQFRRYIESLWLPGMTWETYGRNGWHFDHIVPLSSFDLTDPEQFKKACHYTNLQPLWAADNIRKSNKII